MPVCTEFADDKWDEFISDLGPADKLMCPDDDSDEESDGEGPNAMEVP